MARVDESTPEPSPDEEFVQPLVEEALPAKPSRRRGPGWRVALGSLFLLNALLLAVIFLVPARETRPEFRRARAFVDALVDGAEGETRSGYAQAREMMGESLRAEYPLPDFEAFFEDRVDSFGFLEEARLDEEAISGTSQVRALVYRFRYSGLRGRAVTRRFEVTVYRGPDGPRVTAFRFLE